MEIKIKTQLIGKRFLREKYQSRLVARDSVGNEWRVKKEPEGFIFRHIGDNTGIYGHSDTLETLVLNALTKVVGIQIVVESQCEDSESPFLRGETA